MAKLEEKICKVDELQAHSLGCTYYTYIDIVPYKIQSAVDIWGCLYNSVCHYWTVPERIVIAKTVCIRYKYVYVG